MTAGEHAKAGDVTAEPAARTADVAARLDRFAGLLLAQRAVANVTAARDRAALDEHFADSLALATLIEGPFVDVGSGGGFPGIVLAIATGLPGTLVESASKKARFLQSAVDALALDLRVVGQRAEDAARLPALREGFASATARAVGGVTTVLELTIGFLRVGGAALLQRGAISDEERRALADACLVLGAEVEREILVEGSRERRILVVRKTKPAGPRFPRRAGIPAKRPLCVARDGADD